MRQIKINSTTGSEIVTLQEFKDYARIDTSSDDTLIADIIKQARIWCENYISRDIVAKNRSYYMDNTNGIFDLPFNPVASISSITADGSSVGHTVIGLDNESIELNNGAAEKVTVVYITAGLDDSLLKQAILQLCSTYYDNRADFKVGAAVSDIPTSTRDILSSYKSMFV